MALMKKIFIHGRYDNTKIIKNIKDNCSLNWSITPDITQADYFLSFDSLINRPINKATKYILIRSEPRIVLPANYISHNLKDFDLIIEVGKPKTIFNLTVNHPQKLEILAPDGMPRSNRLVIINSNLLSLRNGELYSLRRDAIFNLEFIDVYGYGWNKSFFLKLKTVFIEIRELCKYPSKISFRGLKKYLKNIPRYKGVSLNKQETLSKYQYALVIENSSEYFSEKFFDALVAGCIPIYVGVDLAKFQIPEDLYIKAEPNLDSIARAFSKARKIDYGLWRIRAYLWLEDGKTKNNWDEIFFIINIKSIIDNHYQ
jgi:hypothetical protein